MEYTPEEKIAIEELNKQKLTSGIICFSLPVKFECILKGPTEVGTQWFNDHKGGCHVLVAWEEKGGWNFKVLHSRDA